MGSEKAWPRASALNLDEIKRISNRFLLDFILFATSEVLLLEPARHRTSSRKPPSLGFGHESAPGFRAESGYWRTASAHTHC